MTKVVMVLPYAHKPFYDEFKVAYEAQNTPTDKMLLLPIDNTGPEGTTSYNAGVAESWNRGIDHIRRSGADWLIIASATIRLGKNGVSEIFSQLKRHHYAQIIHFAKKGTPEKNYHDGDNPPYNTGVFYWHLTAVRADVFDRVGYFDPNFYPIYFEDTDFDIRFNKAYPDPQRLILPVDATSEGVGHAAKLAGIKSPAEPLIAYFATKWGVHPNAVGRLGTYRYPFNDDHNSVKFFPPARGRVWNE